MTAKLIQLIATDDAVLGSGVAGDEFRRSVRLYTPAGAFVASYDPSGPLSGLSPEGMVEILTPEPIEPLRPEPQAHGEVETGTETTSFDMSNVKREPKPPARRKSAKSSPSR